MPLNTLPTHLFQWFSQLLLIQPTTNVKGSLNRLLFFSWLMTDDGVAQRNVLKSKDYLVTGFVTINKIVCYQHLLVSFEEFLSLRVSDPFAGIGCGLNQQ